MTGGIQPCEDCGWAAAGGRGGCRARFDVFIARDFSDALYFRTHRIFVDTYALQHPDEFCRSAKSFAAHLVGLGWILEEGASTAVGAGRLHRWLSGRTDLVKPAALPLTYGAMTIGDLPPDADPNTWAQAVRRWAESNWAAWSDLHPLARHWRSLASGN